MGLGSIDLNHGGACNLQKGLSELKGSVTNENQLHKCIVSNVVTLDWSESWQMGLPGTSMCLTLRARR